jgi:Fe2+ or Zn2+ uptake regulation protein
VDELVKKWDLKKIVGIWSKAYYEKTKPEHIHLIDTNTGQIFDIDKEDLHLAGLPSNFKVWSMDVKIFWEFAS